VHASQVNHPRSWRSNATPGPDALHGPDRRVGKRLDQDQSARSHSDTSVWPPHAGRRRQIIQFGMASRSHRGTQVADHIGGSARGYQELFASLAAGQTRLQSRWPGHRDRIFIRRRSYRERTHLPPTGSSGLPWRWHPRPSCMPRGPVILAAKLIAGHGAEGELREPRPGRPGAAGLEDGLRDGRDVGRVPRDPR
jgi:hypothetical protein